MICGKDDSGTCCGLCHYTPVVVIATHQRKEITTKNIELLKRQTFIPKIVIVCSDKEEFNYYKQLDVSVILEPNRPLGRKWQVGVNAAVKMGANPLVILGSDDLLHYDYIKKGLAKLHDGFDFVGTITWYSLDVKNRNLYHCYYRGINSEFPIGSGKMYSKTLLDKIRNKIFDTSADRKLDDQGHRLIKQNNAKIHLFKEPYILAVKGRWNELNPIEAYLKSPNIKSTKVDLKIIETFDYNF